MPACWVKACPGERIERLSGKISIYIYGGPSPRFDKALNDVVMKNVIVGLNDGLGPIQGKDVKINSGKEPNKCV